MADEEKTNAQPGSEIRHGLSREAEDVLGAVLILERDHVHQERPRVRKELIELIKNHVR